MTIRDSHDNVQSGQFFGSSGKTLAFGGIGSIVILLVGLYFGIDPKLLHDVTQNVVQISSAPTSSENAEIEHALEQGTAHGTIVAARANNTICRIYVATSSANTVWGNAHNSGHWSQANATLYKNNVPKINIFHNHVNTQCGNASSSVGPFYCPADHTAYFDTNFFHSIMQRLGASNGVLAQFYVVEHEIGHHIQTILGYRVRNHRPGPKSDSVRLELQADCFAGFWAYYADKGDNPALASITEAQIRQVIQTTRAIGDDTLQQAHGRVNSLEWTHGSSEQRTRWFLRGYQGNFLACNTWDTNKL